MPKSSASKTTAPPSRLSLKRVSKQSDSSSGTPPTKEKKHITPGNFPLFVLFRKEFMKIHSGVENFLGVQMQNFHQTLEQKFFEWLNFRKNSERPVYEIKREFMCIADAVLLFELANHQRRLTPFGFVIGPLQVTLQQWAEDGDPARFGVIPYSRSLCSLPVSKLDDSRLQIREEELRLAGLEPIEPTDDAFNLPNVSNFFADTE